MTTDAAKMPGEQLADLFVRHHTMLVHFLARLTGCPERAEDLAQVAWLKLLSALMRGICGARGDRELRAYVFEVARNAWLDEYTRKHGEARTRAFDPAEIERLTDAGASEPGPEEQLHRAQIHARVSQAVIELPPEQRLVIRMWSQGTSIRDMARASDAPADTVLSRKK